jgi:hypothetical protein
VKKRHAVSWTGKDRLSALCSIEAGTGLLAAPPDRVGEIAMNDEAPARRRRAGGRRGHSDRAGGAAIAQSPWRIPVNPDRPTEPLDEEGVENIHRGAMRILSEIGIEFLNDEAVGHLKEAGCSVEGQTVRFDPAFVEEMVARAPAEFTLVPRNPERALPVGGRHMLFGNVSSPPNAWDKLTQYFNCIHFAAATRWSRSTCIPASGISTSLRQADADRQGRACLFARGRAGRGRDGDGAHRGRADAMTSSTPRRACTPTSTRPRR